MSSDSTSLVIILVCLVLSAYFSATETAFSTMSHARMKTMADKGDKSAALALQLADNYDTLLSAILIGNNLVVRIGILKEVGASYVIIMNYPRVETMCDMYSIKFVSVINTEIPENFIGI